MRELDIGHYVDLIVACSDHWQQLLRPFMAQLSIYLVVARLFIFAAARGESSLIHITFIGLLNGTGLQILDSVFEQLSGSLSKSTLHAQMKRQIVFGIPMRLRSLLNSNSFGKQELWNLK